MDYKELVFTVSSGESYQQDMLIYALAEIGFDTFEETDHGFKAYIPENKLDQNELENALQGFTGIEFTYQENSIAQTNWNAVWESNFEPITITDQCYVRATFHKPRPEFNYEIVIDPKMAFGTGHHQTTALMMEYMLEEDFKGKSVLDMGCGTGILAILAEKLGAADIVAIDYDEVCYKSTIENAALNQTGKVIAICGSKEEIPDRSFDIILANINRNILLDQMERYSEVLRSKGMLFISGFYESTDLEALLSKGQELGMRYVSHKALANWASVKFVH